jgi:uncharacterized membrane protein YgcG
MELQLLMPMMMERRGAVRWAVEVQELIHQLLRCRPVRRAWYRYVSIHKQRIVFVISCSNTSAETAVSARDCVWVRHGATRVAAQEEALSSMSSRGANRPSHRDVAQHDAAKPYSSTSRVQVRFAVVRVRIVGVYVFVVVGGSGSCGGRGGGGGGSFGFRHRGLGGGGGGGGAELGRGSRHALPAA